MNEKIAIITGAGKGIGSAIAQTLADQGAMVALIDIDQESLEQTTRTISKKGQTADSFSGDILDSDFLKTVTETLFKRHGKIDILVNNAGIIRDNFLANITEQDWDKVLDVNLKGPFLCCQAVFPYMKEKNYGRIVNIISRAWLGNIGQSNYSASKGGLVSLTRTLALELARFKINVNGVAPGLIDTPMTRSMPEKSRERLLRMQPTGTMGTVNDIAEAVAFLASDKANFIIGQILDVDGGKSCGLLSL